MLCLPKKEGGMGIKKLEEYNRVAIMRHIWSFLVKAVSLWIAGVEAILLKGEKLLAGKHFSSLHVKLA
jgi:hypothetical protein